MRIHGTTGLPSMGNTPNRSGHLPINGLNLYYEVYGELGTSKPPLLLIPGAFMATDSRSCSTHPIQRRSRPTSRR